MLPQYVVGALAAEMVVVIILLLEYKRFYKQDIYRFSFTKSLDVFHFAYA